MVKLLSLLELLTQTRKILSYTSTYSPKPGWYYKFDSISVLTHLSVIKRKLVYFFGHPLNKIIFHHN